MFYYAPELFNLNKEIKKTSSNTISEKNQRPLVTIKQQNRRDIKRSIDSSDIKYDTRCNISL